MISSMDASRHEILVWVLRGCFAIALLFCFGYTVRDTRMLLRIRKTKRADGDTGALERARYRWLGIYLLVGAVLIACVWIGPKIGWDR
jgi:hypothetical protein